MCHTTIITHKDGRVLGVSDFTEGFKPLKRPIRIVDEDTILVYAIRLERRGLADEGELLLERFIAGFRWFLM